MKKQKDNVQVPQSGQIAVNTKEHSLLRHIKKEWRLYSLMIIPLLYYIIFKYVPVVGNIIAFRRYKGGPNILGEYWVGFRYFEQFIILEHTEIKYRIFISAFPGYFNLCTSSE